MRNKASLISPLLLINSIRICLLIITTQHTLSRQNSAPHLRHFIWSSDAGGGMMTIGAFGGRRTAFGDEVFILFFRRYFGPLII